MRYPIGYILKPLLETAFGPVIRDVDASVRPCLQSNWLNTTAMCARPRSTGGMWA